MSKRTLVLTNVHCAWMAKKCAKKTFNRLNSFILYNKSSVLTENIIYADIDNFTWYSKQIKDQLKSDGL